MPYERITHYRHEPDTSSTPSSTMIDGLEVVDDQPVVLAPLETVTSTHPRSRAARAPRPVTYRPHDSWSPHGMG